MDRQLPAEQEKMCEHLTERWITSQETVAKQIDGCNTILFAMLDTLNPLLGAVATRAIMNRASILAHREYELLGNVIITMNGLDVSRLKADLQGKPQDQTREALAGLIGELFMVLNGLLGSSVMPVLRDLESKLAARESEPPDGKEGS